MYKLIYTTHFLDGVCGLENFLYNIERTTVINKMTFSKYNPFAIISFTDQT